jgi:uncharacterized protein (DUF433 family)
MTDTFLNLYENSFQKQLEFAKIIGAYQGLVSVTISELKDDYPLYTKEQLIEKLQLQHEQLKQKFQEATS